MSHWTESERAELDAAIDHFERDFQNDPQRHNPRAERTSDAFHRWLIETLRRAALPTSDRTATKE